MKTALGSADAVLPTRSRSRSRLQPRRRLGTFGVVLALACVLTVSGPTPVADAAPGDLACFVNFQLNFTPPLTATNPTADVDANAGLVDCESPNGQFPDLASGIVAASGDATSIAGVPCNLLLTAEGSGKITWNTNQVSHFDFFVNTDPVAGTVTFSAEITSGPLDGDTALAVPFEANPNFDCTLNGLRSLTSVLALVSFA